MTPVAPASAAASPPQDSRSISERAAHVARVRDALLAWRRVLEGEPVDAPAVEYRPPADDGRLQMLRERFGLDALEADTVRTLWALAYTPEWRQLVAALDGGAVTPLGVALLHGHPPRARLSSESPLLAWHIVSEQPQAGCANPGLSIDPHILAWLEGSHELDRALVPSVRLIAPGGVLDSWPVARTAATIRDALSRGDRVLVQLTGRDPASAIAFASAVAAGLGLPLVEITPRASEGDPRELFVRIQRQAFLDRSAPLWMRPTADEGLPWPTHIAWFPLQFVFGDAASTRPSAGVREITIGLPPPSAAERRALWLQALPHAREWDEAALDALARRYVAQPGDIAAVAAMRPASANEAARHLLARGRGNLGSLAQRLETSFTWDDLVVPRRVGDALRDIAFEATDRRAFWEQPQVARLFPQGRGLVALFCGPPGTGKTMAAQVIAAELGLDLYRVDLSAVISKWVGETAQHLEKVLARAADQNLALFFDEADALYGKRVDEVRDAQDRFANMDISHLMVAIENYTGIVLLASNLKTNIDPAFIRRIRYCVEFPKPDRAARRAIWERVAAALWSTRVATALGPALDELAEHEVTGAQIKHACLSAAFTARRNGRRPTRHVLALALARELTKDGQGISERALAKLAGPARANGDRAHG
jgi:adenylate kinase family enzyme